MIFEGMNGETEAIAGGGQNMVTVSSDMAGYQQRVAGLGDQLRPYFNTGGSSVMWEQLLDDFHQASGKLISSSELMGTTFGRTANIMDDSEALANRQLSNVNMERALNPSAAGRA
ncbi:hypothetical protein [Actinoplanes sp. NPDC089786]|uniref:hypothetical protein n=1 Tax=Actinoplanes sp. NPDC089786 TaxID=3155185 RepID=UPI00343689F0